MNRRFKPLSPRVGAEASVGREEMLDPAFAAECLEALERFGVLVFPRINLSDEQQLAFSASRFVELPDEESRALLAKLTAHATRREIVYQHEWQIGDLVIWDNCGTMHRVIPYDPLSGRMLHRTTLHGVEAIGA